jgi:hypothetical protein
VSLNLPGLSSNSKSSHLYLQSNGNYRCALGWFTCYLVLMKLCIIINIGSKFILFFKLLMYIFEKGMVWLSFFFIFLLLFICAKFILKDRKIKFCLHSLTMLNSKSILLILFLALIQGIRVIEILCVLGGSCLPLYV